jgi:protein-tyrosine-phosphatase/predicted ATP-grasp superfamily ATP-dependent carboligase
VEVAQSLGREGCQVDAASEHPYALGLRSRRAQNAMRAPQPADTAAFLDWLRQVDNNEKYSLIVCSTEASLLAVRTLKESDPLRLKAVLPSDSTLDVALDKDASRRLALTCDVRVPETRTVFRQADVKAVASFPMVLKPMRSKVVVGDRLVTIEPVIARDDATRRAQLLRWLPYTPVLEQEFIQGWGVGIELLYAHGRVCWSFAHERIHEWPLTGGASSYRRAIRPPELALAGAIRLLDALHWHGVAMVEFKRTPAGEFVLMEINPRFWGSLALSIDAGVNFPSALLQLATGREIPPQPAYRVGYTTRYVPTDVRWMKANLTASRNDPLLLTRPRFRSILEWFRPLLGRESWDHFDWRDLAVTARTLTELPGVQGLWVRRQMRSTHRRALRNLQSRPIRTVLFMCSGNLCRSALAHKLAETRLANLRVESAALDTDGGRPSPPQMRAAASRRNIDLSNWQSRSITKAQIDRADLILLMDRKNFVTLAQRFPDALDRTVMLGLFGQRSSLDITDPNGGKDRAFEKACETIHDCVAGLSGWLTPANAAPSGNTAFAMKEPG